MSVGSHVVLPGSRRGPDRAAKVVGLVDPDAWVEVTVKVRRKAPLPAVESRPSAPVPRHELASRFGATDDDLALVKTSMESYGLEVVASDPATRSVKVAGPAHQMEEAFRVKLLNATQPRGTYRTRVGTLQVPKELDGVVVGVFGLDDRPVVNRRSSVVRKAKSHGRHPAKPNPPPQAPQPPAAAAQKRSGYLPSELAGYYQFPAGDGAGETIGLLEFGGGYFADDLAAFCSSAGVAVPKVVTVSVDGQATDARDGAEDEVMLDVEVAAGVCPAATLAVYFAPFSERGWVDILSAAVHDATNAPGVLSISWGLSEDDPSWSASAVEAINESLQEAALAGLTVLVASGDDGSGDQETDGHAHVNFPASSPFVVAVGGTTLRVRNNLPTETAWKEGDGKRADNGGSSGGGVSTVFPRPDWQTVSVPSVNPGSIDGRVVPDVSADAAGSPGYFLVVDGQSAAAGGTSAAAPLWAGLVARLNAALGGKHVGYLTPLLYENLPGGGTALGAESCTDVTTGDNKTATVGGYSAGRGFDAVTGWGSPLGDKLLANLKALI